MCLLRGTDWVFIYNSTFCPHSVFVCFVWISEQTAIIPLYNINLLVFFITKTDCVYCAVRTELSQSVSMCFGRWPLNTEARVRSQVSTCYICGGQSGTGTGLSPSTWVFLCHYHSTNVPYSSTCCSWQKVKQVKAGNLPTSNALL